MTYLFSASYFPITNLFVEDSMFRFKNLLVSAGYVVVSSSNGTTLQAGDLITSGAVLQNANSYFIIKQPLAATSSHGGLRREWGIQRGTTLNTWRTSYCAETEHTDGGSATVMPSGSDRKWILEAAGSAWQNGNYTTAFAGATTLRFNMCVDNAPPFGWYFVGCPIYDNTETGTPTCVLLFDPMMSGTFASQDLDPVVNVASISAQSSFAGNGNMSQAATASNTIVPKGWLAKGAASGAFVGFQAGIPRYSVNGTLTDISADSGTNFFGGDDTFLVFYMKPTTVGSPIGGLKGFSSMLKGKFYNSQLQQTYNSGSGTKNQIAFREYVLPWNGSDSII